MSATTLPRPRLCDPQPRHALECPVEDWLTFFGHRWNAIVMWHLSTGPKRHGELMAALPGVTAKVLAERLEGLERRGIVGRTVGGGFPRTVSYRLTGQGHEMIAIFDQIDGWAARQSAVSAA